MWYCHKLKRGTDVSLVYPTLIYHHQTNLISLSVEKTVPLFCASSFNDWFVQVMVSILLKIFCEEGLTCLRCMLLYIHSKKNHPLSVANRVCFLLLPCLMADPPLDWNLFERQLPFQAGISKCLHGIPHCIFRKRLGPWSVECQQTLELVMKPWKQVISI